MRMQEIDFDGQPPVDAYGPGYFRLGDDKKTEGPLLISPSGLHAWAGYAEIDTITDMSSEFDVIFIGTGSDISALPPSCRSALEKAGVAYEVMATPPACRTYNVLLSEGRRVALAALPV